MVIGALIASAVALGANSTVHSAPLQSACQGSTQDCCVQGTAPGCADPSCCSTVCAADPYCCDTRWDGPCAIAAQETCQACRCGAGDCCSPHGGQGCDDFECCTIVCAEDAYCCDTEWDGACALRARASCGTVCHYACALPSFTTIELEQCLQDLNGDCDGPGNQPISIGQSIRGTVWGLVDANGVSLRDVDYYKFQVGAGTSVTLEVFSEALCFAAVLRAGDCDNLLMVTESDPVLGECPSRGEVCLATGSYLIFVAPNAFSGIDCDPAAGFASGEYVLRVSGAPCNANPPPNDSCASGLPIEFAAGHDSIDLPFTNRFASWNFNQPSCGVGGEAFTGDLFWLFRPTVTGDYLLSTCGDGPDSVSFDTGIEVWSGCPVDGQSPIVCNDDGNLCNYQDGSDLQYASSLYVTLTALAPNDPPYVIRIGGWNGAVGDATLHLEFVGTQPSCDDPGALQCCVPHGADQPFCADEICCERICGIDAYCCAITWDSVCASAARSYCEVCGGSTGGAPGNDVCTNATPIILNQSINLHTTDATTTTAIAPCTGSPLARDVFFLFVPPQSKSYAFDTCTGGDGTAAFDTVIEAWSGCPESGGVAIACNDDGNCTALRSSLVVPLQAGVPTIIRVGGADTSAGDATLRVSEGPQGLACSDPISVASGVHPFDRALATEDVDLGASCTLASGANNSVWNSIWFEYQAEHSGPCIVSTCGTVEHDTRLAVMGSCDPTSAIACNDDAACGTASELTFDAQCGQTYLIAVGGYSSTTFTGAGSVSISASGPVCPPPLAGDLNRDGAVDGADLGVMLTSWGTAQGDVNGDGATDGADLGVLLTNWTG